MITKARVLKTIRSEVDDLRNTLLPRQSGAVSGEVYSNAGEGFQREKGSVVQVTEAGRVVEAPDVKRVVEIAEEISNDRTASLEASLNELISEGVGTEYLSAYAMGTMATSNVLFNLSPTIQNATGFFLSGGNIICEKPGRYVFAVRCSLDGTITGSNQAFGTFAIRKNNVVNAQVSASPILKTVRYLYMDCGTIVSVINLSAGDAITFDATVIATTAFARVDVSAWCVSERKNPVALGDRVPITESDFFKSVAENYTVEEFDAYILPGRMLWAKFRLQRSSGTLDLSTTMATISTAYRPSISMRFAIFATAPEGAITAMVNTSGAVRVENVTSGQRTAYFHLFYPVNVDA